MYFKKISLYDLTNVTANVFRNRKNGELYYNLRLGTPGEKTWEYNLLFDKRYYSPKDENNRLELTDSNYIVKPIKVKSSDGRKVCKKDGKDNIFYVVTEDQASFHKKDLILVWELPNRNFTNIQYDIKGPHNILAKASTGKERDDNVYSSPILLIELLGNCTLSWNGEQDTGDVLEQTIDFNYESGQFTIDIIKSKE